MKKVLKNSIFTFVLGLLIATTIGVSATILYQADEVGFTPSNPNWNVNNLEDALNDLYSNGASVVYETGSFSKYISYSSYAIVDVDLENEYTEEDNAIIIIDSISPYAPLYFDAEVNTKIVGNQKRVVIVNYAGNSSYSKTYTINYKIIKS